MAWCEVKHRDMLAVEILFGTHSYLLTVLCMALKLNLSKYW